MAVNTRTEFASGHTRARWVVTLLAFTIVLTLVAMASQAAEIELLNRALAGELITEAEAQSNDERQTLVGVVQIVVLLITAVVFLMWVYRVRKNLSALGATNLKHSPRWAVAAFLVPIVNLSRPVSVMQEVWKASDPHAVEDGSWQKARSPRLVELWWGLFAAAEMIDGFVARTSMRGEQSISSLTAFSWVSLVTDLMELVAAALAILVVRAIDARQEAKHRRMAVPSARQDYVSIG